MSLFDGVTLNGGGIFEQLAQGALEIYKGRLSNQAMKRAMRGGKSIPAQVPGWGGGGGMLGLAGVGQGGIIDVLIGENNQGGQTQVGPFQSGQTIEGEYSTVDPVTGEVRMKRLPSHPATVEIVGTDGKNYRYRSEGRALLSTLDMSGYRKVCRVAHELLGNLGGATPKRRARTYRKGKKICRTKPRKVSCRTLSPKQLAAGFGGKQYRTR